MITNTELEYKGDLYPSEIVSFKQEVDSVYFHTDNSVILKITVLRDSMIRFRYTTKGYFSNDFSYAIDKSHSHGYNFLEVTEASLYYQIKTSKVQCRIQKIDMRVSIYDLNENVLLEDELGFHWEESYEYGGNIVKMSKASKEGECFYGLGDKATQLNLKGKRLENFATDQYAFSKDQEPLYKVVPFYIGLQKKQSYGIFFDNTFRKHFYFWKSTFENSKIQSIFLHNNAFAQKRIPRLLWKKINPACAQKQKHGGTPLWYNSSSQIFTTTGITIFMVYFISRTYDNICLLTTENGNNIYPIYVYNNQRMLNGDTKQSNITIGKSNDNIITLYTCSINISSESAQWYEAIYNQQNTLKSNPITFPGVTSFIQSRNNDYLLGFGGSTGWLGNYSFTGNIGEILVYDNFLDPTISSDSSLYNQNVSYLRNKWNI
jgi:hypothetical protein